MSLNILQPIPDFIAAIEGGFRHSDLPAVLQKIYLEYWLRNWIVAYKYNSLPAFHSPMQALRQAASGVHFKTPTNLSGESMSDTFDGAPMLGVGEERVDYLSPSSLEGPYKDYKDRYWYMDFYAGPQPPSDELSPVAAGADRYDAYPNRSFFELPPDVERIYGYNVFPRLRPPNMDTQNPYTEGGNHDTYLTDLNYDGIVPGMNQNQVHVFIEWILVQLLRGSSLVTPLYLSYIRHDPPYEPYSRANNYADIFADAEVEGGLGLIAREGASNTYSLTRAKIYVDILKVLDALKMFRIVQEWRNPGASPEWPQFVLDPETMEADCYTVAANLPKWFFGTFDPILMEYLNYYGEARRTTDAEHPIMFAQVAGSYSGLIWVPSGPPYSLAGTFQETTTDRYPILWFRYLRGGQTPSQYYYYGGTGRVMTIVPTACRYLNDCGVKQAFQHMHVNLAYGSRLTTSAIAARDWHFSTSWGMDVLIPQDSVFPTARIQNNDVICNRFAVRQEVDVSTFFAHVLTEYAHAEVMCEFVDHTPPTTHGLYYSNNFTGMLIETTPRFDLVADVSGVFKRFRDENTLPPAYDWQGYAIDGSIYVPYHEIW